MSSTGIGGLLLTEKGISLIPFETLGSVNCIKSRSTKRNLIFKESGEGPPITPNFPKFENWASLLKMDEVEYDQAETTETSVRFILKMN